MGKSALAITRVANETGLETLQCGVTKDTVVVEGEAAVTTAAAFSACPSILNWATTESGRDKIGKLESVTWIRVPPKMSARDALTYVTPMGAVGLPMY